MKHSEELDHANMVVTCMNEWSVDVLLGSSTAWLEPGIRLMDLLKGLVGTS
jgi:hypothetical protein